MRTHRTNVCSVESNEDAKESEEHSEMYRRKEEYKSPGKYVDSYPSET